MKFSNFFDKKCFLCDKDIHIIKYNNDFYITENKDELIFSCIREYNYNIQADIVIDKSTGTILKNIKDAYRVTVSLRSNCECNEYCILSNKFKMKSSFKEIKNIYILHEVFSYKGFQVSCLFSDDRSLVETSIQINRSKTVIGKIPFIKENKDKLFKKLDNLIAIS